MEVIISDQFKDALKESDSTLILGNCTTDNIIPEFYYIWDKNHQVLYLSISFDKNSGYKGDNILLYFRKKHETSKKFEKKAITITKNNENFNKLIEIDLSNIGVESEIESSLPGSNTGTDTEMKTGDLSLVEDFNLDIGSSIYLTDKDNSKNLITKASFTKLLYSTKNVDSSLEFDYGKTILSNTGETIYRKFKYRRYNKDSFSPKLVGSVVTTMEDGIECYNIENNRTVLRLTGQIGYTDLIVENSKILEEVEGIQGINELLNISITKKYKDSKNIWENSVTVDENLNIIVPENKTGKSRKEILILSVNFVDYDNSIIQFSKEIKICQARILEDIKPWDIVYENKENIRIEYETSQDKSIPVIIFIEPKQEDLEAKKEYTDLNTVIKLNCNPEIIEPLRQGEIKVSYEYLSEEYSTSEDPGTIFTDFFNIELNPDIENKNINLNITANSLLKSEENAGIVSDKLWYPYITDKPLVIKYIVSVDLMGYLGIHEYKEEFIFIRQPENIHKYGSISLINISNEGLLIRNFNNHSNEAHEIFNINFEIDKNIITFDPNNQDNYIKYSGWIFEDINSVEKHISKDEFIITKYNKFNNDSLTSDGKLTFIYDKYSDYLFNSGKSDTVVDLKIGEIILNGLSSYYFKKDTDNSFLDVYNRVSTSVSWVDKVFMTRIKKDINCFYNTQIYTKSEGQEYNHTISPEMSVDIKSSSNFGILHIRQIYPFKLKIEDPSLVLINLEDGKELVTGKYYNFKGISSFKYRRNFITNSEESLRSSLYYEVNNSYKTSINFVGQSDRTEFYDNHVEALLGESNCFRILEPDNVSDSLGVFDNSTLRVKSNFDVVFSCENIENYFNIGTLKNPLVGNNALLYPEFNKEKYLYHNIEIYSKQEHKKIIDKCPIRFDKYNADLSSCKINSSDNIDTELINTVSVLNTDRFINPVLYDKLGNNIANGLDILMFDYPENYSMEDNTEDDFYVLSAYPLSTRSVNLKIDSIAEMYWKESDKTFTMSSTNFIELGSDVVYKSEIPDLLRTISCAPVLYKHLDTKNKNIFNRFKIKKTDTNSSTDIECNVCSENIISGFKLVDNYEDSYESVGNIPINSIIPSFKSTVKCLYLGSIDNNSDGNEYVKVDDKKFNLGLYDRIRLDTIYESNHVNLDYYKWYQSDVEEISILGSVCSNSFGENSKISCKYVENNDILETVVFGVNSGKLKPRISSLDSTGGNLYGISKIPITLDLIHEYYDTITPENNLFNLVDKQSQGISVNLSTDRSEYLNTVSNSLHSTSYELYIKLVNRLLVNGKKEPFKYIRRVLIPWEGLNNAFLIDKNEASLVHPFYVMFEKDGCLSIDLGRYSWSTTSVSFYILPVSIESGYNDLINLQKTNSLVGGNASYSIKLKKDVNYYSRLKTAIAKESDCYAFVMNNIPKTITKDLLYSVKDISSVVTLNFPQNITNNSVKREFEIVLDNGKTLPIEITQTGITGDIKLSIKSKETECILLHSSGRCINDYLEAGVLKLVSSTSNIFNYTDNSVNLYFTDSQDDNDPGIYIPNQADIKTLDTSSFEITITADFPTRYTKPKDNSSALVGKVLIKDNNNNILKKFNCYQGYTYSKLIDENNNEYLVDLINSEYIGEVGSKDSPICYNLAGNTPSYRVAIYQRELSYDRYYKKFKNELSGKEQRVTIGERTSTNSDYSSITFSDLHWELLGNSRFILKNDYYTDIQYVEVSENNESMSYPTLIHNFKIEEDTNYDIDTTKDLVNIKLSVCLSNHKLTADISIPNNSVPSSDLISNSPIIYSFWINYHN